MDDLMRNKIKRNDSLEKGDKNDLSFAKSNTSRTYVNFQSKKYSTYTNMLISEGHGLKPAKSARSNPKTRIPASQFYGATMTGTSKGSFSKPSCSRIKPNLDKLDFILPF